MKNVTIICKKTERYIKMIEKLEKLFGKDAVTVTVNHNTYSEYTWYLLDTEDVIGIKKSSVSKEQDQLLSTLFKKMDSPLIEPTRFTDWYDYLYNNKGTNPFTLEPSQKLPNTIRFIHFYSDHNFSTKDDFEEAILAFFQEEVMIVWSSAREGIIIEKNSDDQLDHSFLGHMQELISADLYFDVTFLVGKRYTPLSDLQLYFQIEQKCFQYALKNKKQKSILWFSKEMIQYILSFLPEDLSKTLPKLLLNDMKLDDPIISTVRAYLQNNMNVTATSKKAFLHRNTVQYRLDKFTEQTGIDLKHFDDGLIVFLAIQLLSLIEPS